MKNFVCEKVMSLVGFSRDVVLLRLLLRLLLLLLHQELRVVSLLSYGPSGTNVPSACRVLE